MKKGIFTVFALGMTSILLAGCWGKKDKTVTKTEETREEKTEEKEIEKTDSDEKKEEEK